MQSPLNSGNTWKARYCKIVNLICLAPVIQKLDRTIHQINLYPVDKYQLNQLHHSLDRDYPEDSAIHLLNNLALINKGTN